MPKTEKPGPRDAAPVAPSRLNSGPTTSTHSGINPLKKRTPDSFFKAADVNCLPGIK